MDISTRPNPLRLNLGAGKQRLDGYVAVDMYADGEGVIGCDVRRLHESFEPGNVDEIMAVHLFEHLFRWDAMPTLAHWFAMLKPGGLLVLELPDLIACCRNVLDDRGERAGLWGLYGDPGYEREEMVHKWAYSERELTLMLKASGFARVRRKPVQFHKKYRDMRLEAVKP